MSARIVTFLGLGQYQSCIYELDGRRTSETAMHDAATVIATGEPTSIIVIGTQEVWEKWFAADARYTTLLAEACPLPTRVGFQLIPHGRTEEERWAIFEAIRRCLSTRPLDDPTPRQEDVPLAWTEPEAPTELILDVTHGFRSQPVFGMAVAGYVNSQLRRDDRKIDLRILYALFEPGVPLTPVLDLTQLLDVMVWDHAIDSLQRHGRADDLERLLDAQQRTLMRHPDARTQARPSLQKLGGALKSFADALVTTRTGDLLTRRAPALEAALSDTLLDLQTHVPPLKEQVEGLSDWAKRLQADQPISPKGIGAMLELAKLYEKTQRYAELSALLRELLISAWTLAILPPEAIIQPGTGGRNGDSSGFTAQRNAVEAHLLPLSHDKAARGIPQRYAQLTDLRNDVLHCAHRDNPRLPSPVRDQLHEQLNRITAALADRTFVACSNHPVSNWARDQVEAATAVGYGPPIHLDFPNVDPDADEDALARQADLLCDAILELRPAQVFIAGEFGLTMATVQRLHQAGVVCVSATARREVVERVLPDGATERQTVFRFVRWRRYLRG